MISHHQLSKPHDLYYPYCLLFQHRNIGNKKVIFRQKPLIEIYEILLIFFPQILKKALRHGYHL